MAFIDHIREGGATLFFYCRVSGLPHIWSSIALPHEWESSPGYVTIAGEQYAHHSTLVPGPTWATVEERAEPWTGLATASQLQVDFLLPGTPDALWEQLDPWMQLLANSYRRNGRAPVLTSNLTTTATTADVDRTTNLEASGIAYIGDETVTYTGVTSTSLTGLTRGRWGSMARYHVADIDAARESGSGGPYVHNHPLTIEGRIFELWIGTGYEDPVTGRLRPWGATIASTEDRQIYAGVVRGARPDKVAGMVRLDVEGLRSLLATEVATRLPRAIAGSGSATSAIYIDDSNNRIGWRWSVASRDGVDISGTGIIPPGGEEPSVRLVRDDGSGNDEELPDGWYSAAELSDAIHWTMTRRSGVFVPGYSPDPSKFSAGLQLDSLAGEGRRWRVWASAEVTAGTEVGSYQLAVIGVGQRGSLWRSLGFTEDVVSEAEFTTSTGWSVYAQRGPALFWLPAAPEGVGRQIQYHSHTGPAFTHSPGWFDDHGNAVPGYIRIGEEIVELTMVATHAGAGMAQIHYLQIGAREQFGSVSADEIYIEESTDGAEDAPQITQGLAFPRTLWGNTALYLATMMDGAGGNGPEDVGWRGGGAAIHVGRIDVPSWSFTSQATEGQRSIAVFAAQTIEEILARNLVLSQAVITARFDADSGRYQLVARDLRPPLEHEGGEGHVLNASNLVTLDGPGIVWEVSESGIVNVIIADGIGYDHGAEKARQRTTWKDVTSAGTWGAARPLDVDVRDVEPGDVSASLSAFVHLTQKLAARYSRPFLLMRLSVALPDPGWMIEIGDDVLITHPLVLRHASVGRGVTGLVGRVFGVRKQYRGSGPAATVTVICAGSGKFAGWAPSALAWEAVSTTQFRVRDHWDSSDSDVRDIERFPVGCAVIVSQPGNEASGVVRTVTTVTLSGTGDQSTITLNNALPFAPPLLIEAAPYNNASTFEGHRRYAYLSDGDGVLDRPSGAPDEAYEYL